MTDIDYMMQALKLSLRGSGHVSPNPRVGAVIVKDDNIIGRGWHHEFGAPHAEVEAIIDAGIDNFEGCTMYVNLEPCSHYGKTPPCAPLLVEKKFSRVVVGMKDPNPDVNGSGIDILRAGGVDVETGVLEEESKWVNRFFEKHITTGLPYVILKVAQSIDGCIATSTGESKWITSPESRKKVHAIRAEVDAVLVGRGTVSKDNPSLTVRDVAGRNPMKVILDSSLSLPLNLNTFSDEGRSKTIICCNYEAAKSKKAQNLALAGINILPVELDDDGKIDITSALYALSDNFNISSIMVEGGSSVFSSFVQSRLVDEYHIFVAPKLIGAGIHSFNQYKIQYLREAMNFDICNVAKSGADLHIIAKKSLGAFSV